MKAHSAREGSTPSASKTYIFQSELGVSEEGGMAERIVFEYLNGKPESGIPVSLEEKYETDLKKAARAYYENRKRSTLEKVKELRTHIELWM